MRHFYLFIAAVTAFAIAALTQPAQAMYHPTMGRFLQRDPIGYSDGMNLYEYVKSTPCDATDAYGEKAVKGNEWGDWEVVQESHSGGDPLKAKFGKGAYYWSDMTAFFVPNAKKVCCDVIAFIQILRRTSSTTGANMNPTYVVKRQTESGWAVDSPKLANSPWNGYDNEGNPPSTHAGSYYRTAT